MRRSDTVRFASAEGVHFQGAIEGRNIAMFCTADEDAVNPTCMAEASLRSGELAVSSTFPPTAIEDLKYIIQIGDDLFADIASQCTTS